MSTLKEFKVVGVSFHNGAYKVRYANSTSRAKVLAKNGHTDILLIELEQAERKMECMHMLLDYMDSAQCELNEAQRAAVVEEAREMGYVIA